MPSKPPKPQQAPFQQKQQNTTTYGTFSPGETAAGQAFLNAPLDFGDETDVDPGVARRTDLAEQEAENRANSAVSMGTPGFIRQNNQARELRDIRSQGAYEAANARFLNQEGNNARRAMMTQTNLARLQAVLPQILRLGGTEEASGYSTQFPQSQPGFGQRLALGLIGNGAQAARMYGGG